MTKCQDCGRPVLLVRRATNVWGEMIVLEPEPDPEGEWIVAQGRAHHVPGPEAAFVAPRRRFYRRHSCD